MSRRWRLAKPMLSLSLVKATSSLSASTTKDSAEENLLFKFEKVMFANLFTHTFKTIILITKYLLIIENS